MFHFQYFGSTPYRGFTEGKVWKYEGREKYEQKLEQMKAELKSKNLAPPDHRKLKLEVTDFEVKKSKSDWLVACEQADEALPLSRAERIKTLTFEYIGPKVKESRAAADESDEEESVKPKSKPSTPKSRKSTSDLKRSVSKVSGFKTPASKRKKKKANSDPTDVYDFNEASSDEDGQPAKFELSSAKRAKGEFAFYEKQMRDSVEKENPKLSKEEIDRKLRRNWELMSEDMRNSYAPRSSQFTNTQNQQNGKEEAKGRRSSLKRSLPVFTTDDEPEVRENGNAEPEKNLANVSQRASRSSARRFKTPLKAETTTASSSENHKKAESPASSTVTTATNSTINNFKSNSIKSKSINQLEENGVSEDSLSCSSDEKAEQQKEQLCGKCGKLDKGLIPCEG